MTVPFLPRRVVVIGLGLIGGSFALALKARDEKVHVTGVGRKTTLGSVAARRCSDELVDAADETALRQALERADLTLLATPIAIIERELPLALELCPRVTDAGSTKRSIVAVAQRQTARARFVPGHPMAGKPQGGVDQATADLFQGRPWILCPDGADPELFAELEQLVSSFGAQPIRLDPEDHDRAVALTSHVPQLVASLLLDRASQVPGYETASGPGFHSATRVAGGPAAVWEDIFSSNADQISAWLSELAEALHEIGDALGGTPPDVGPALELLERARNVRRGA